MYLLYRIGTFLALTLPLNVSYRLADILGSLYYLLARRDKKVVINNIKVVLNQTGNSHQLRYSSRMVFVNFARYLLEFLRVSKIDLRYIEKYVTIVGKENLDKVLKLGRGALLVSAHLGNWELGGIALAMLGYKVNVIAWTHKNRRVNDFFLEQRQSKGLKVIPLGVGIRKAFSALQNNEMIGFLGDVDYAAPGHGLRVQFFGRDTIMPKGPAAFSVKTGAPIVPLFMVREEGNKFRFICGSPIIYQAAAEPNMSTLGTRDTERLRNLTQDLARVIESYIARYPAQWFMLTPRWQKP